MMWLVPVKRSHRISLYMTMCAIGAPLIWLSMWICDQQDVWPPMWALGMSFVLFQLGGCMVGFGLILLVLRGWQKHLSWTES